MPEKTPAETQNRILRRTINDLRKRIKIAEITILLEDKTTLFLLNRKLAKNRLRLRELARAYRESKEDYNRILVKFDEITKEKKCIMCGENKSIESFEINPQFPIGRGPRCNACNSQRLTKYRKTAKVFKELVKA